MSCIAILRRLGILPRIFRSEIEAADSENIVRTMIEHGRAVNGIEAASQEKQRTNGRLRASINRALQSSSFDLRDLGEDVLRTMDGKKRL